MVSYVDRPELASLTALCLLDEGVEWDAAVLSHIRTCTGGVPTTFLHISHMFESSVMVHWWHRVHYARKHML